jgi:hypothetical protein
MSGSLDGPVFKIRRAKEHYETFGSEHPWLLTNTYPVLPETDAERLNYVFRVGEVEPIDVEAWAAFLDVFVFNLRSALDDLIYELHVLHYDGAVPPDVEELCCFPIFLEPHDVFNDPAIANLDAQHRTLIETLQPYQYGHAEGLEFVRVSLRWLQALYLDRDLHVVRNVQHGYLVRTFPEEYGFEQHPVTGVPVESNAVVDRSTFTKLPQDVDVSNEVTLHESVDDGTGVYVQVRTILQLIFNDVLKVFALFTGDFPPILLPRDVWLLGQADPGP